MTKFMLITTMPPEDLDGVLAALAEAGAGQVGEYSECAFVCTGRGRFRAGEGAHPATGKAGALNEVAEVRVETWVEQDRARAVLAALRAAHPYEEPVVYLLPLMDEGAL